MRAFWAIIIGLVLAAAGVMAWNAVRSETIARKAEQGLPPAPVVAADAATESDINTSRMSATGSEGSNNAPKPTHDASRAHSPGYFAGDKPVTSAESTQKSPDGATGNPGDAAPLIPPMHAPAKIDEWEVMGSKSVEELESGALRIDGRFTLRGAGTKSDPIRIPWELLVSAEDVFDPSRNRRRIPESVALLHGKYVALEGYVLFPLQTTQPRELLVMMNTWDGCCIGVPPTPYDAVEVRLTGSIKGDDRFAISGTVIGKFSVKPYVVKNWLVGIYVIDDASFQAGVDDAGLGT